MGGVVCPVYTGTVNSYSSRLGNQESQDELERTMILLIQLHVVVTGSVANCLDRVTQE